MQTWQWSLSSCWNGSIPTVIKPSMWWRQMMICTSTLTSSTPQFSQTRGRTCWWAASSAMLSPSRIPTTSGMFRTICSRESGILTTCQVHTHTDTLLYVVFLSQSSSSCYIILCSVEIIFNSLGTAYLMARTTVSKLYNASLDTPMFHLEDIFVTGMLSAKVRIRPVDNIGFSYVRRKLNSCLFKQSISTHKIKLIEMKAIYDKLQSSKNQECPKIKSRLMRDYGPGKCTWPKVWFEL